MISKSNQYCRTTFHIFSYFPDTFPADAFAKDRRSQTTLIALLGILYVCDQSSILMPLYVILHEEGWYLSAYFLKPLYAFKETHGIALGIGFLFEFWFVSTQWAGLFLQCFIHLIYLQTMKTSLENLR